MSNAPTAHARFLRNVRDAVANPTLDRQLQGVTQAFYALRAASIASVPDWEERRERARAVKAETLAHLDRYLAEFERQVEAHGGRVHHAGTADEASRIVADLARARGVGTIVKSKSMVTEEVRLNHRLAEAGIESIETDLGEFIIQLAGEAPSHIIAPAIHKSRAQVGQLLHEKLGVPYTETVDEMTAAVRARLRGEFRRAGMGVSGANFGVASTGTIVILENEGNARLTTSAPKIHVAVMGIEKLVPRAEDLAVFLTLLPRSATGQVMSSYVSLITGPKRAGERDGPEELHVVLLDNGRRAMLADPIMREALHCIRCGACMNVCPVYRAIGGHAYGTVYGGPIGSVISSSLEPARSAPDLPFASSLCGACADVCPVKIPLPELLVHLRQRYASEVQTQAQAMPGRGAQRAAMRAWAFAMTGRKRYRSASRLLRVLLAPFARGGWISRIPGAAGGWTAVRDLPMPARRTFIEEFESRRKP